MEEKDKLTEDIRRAVAFGLKPSDRSVPERRTVMGDTVTWSSYQFEVYDFSAQWNNVSGIYIFAGLNQQNQWKAYYVGQAGSFQDRIPSHEKRASALSLGATHIHAAVLPEDTLDSVEGELIQIYKPPLNQQGK